ncbi:MAG: ornithine cyclodeaminase family protein [Chloroflexi bacterium]|nr:ornithine cyclodeaminase family protein [Chloroflexota bacterium]
MGYFAIRMKSDIVYQTAYAGALTTEKYCMQPGLFCGLILLVKVETGEPLAIINDGYLQHFRVGSDSAIGTKHVAREDAHVLGMLGSGGMARSHVESLRLVRKIDRVQVFSRTREHREAYAREVAEKHDIEAVPVDGPRAVFRGADIVCGCTDSARPVIIGDWLEPGTHATCVGGRPDADTFTRADRWLRLGSSPGPVGVPEWAVHDESVAYAARGAGPGEGAGRGGRSHGVDRPEKTVFLEDLLAGRARGRTSPEQITYSERGNVLGAVLDEIDVLIDGPYVEMLADQVGPWTGSSNQRVIDLAATRRIGQVACLGEATASSAKRIDELTGWAA